MGTKSLKHQGLQFKAPWSRSSVCEEFMGGQRGHGYFVTYALEGV